MCCAAEHGAALSPAGRCAAQSEHAGFDRFRKHGGKEEAGATTTKCNKLRRGKWQGSSKSLVLGGRPPRHGGVCSAQCPWMIHADVGGVDMFVNPRALLCFVCKGSDERGIDSSLSACAQGRESYSSSSHSQVRKKLGDRQTWSHGWLLVYWI